MKRLVGSFILGTMLLVGAGQAQAEIVTDWTYEITNVAFTNPSYDASTGDWSFTNSAAQLDWDSAITTGSMDINNTGGTGTVASSKNHNALTHTVEFLVDSFSNGYANEQIITNLLFEYSVYSPSTNMYLEATYFAPLKYFTDGVNEYVYYDQFQGGSTHAILGDYDYKIDQPSLFIDGRPLTGQGGTQVGWTINEDTMTYYYDSYIVGGVNTPIQSNGQDSLKPFGLFDIDFKFSVSQEDLDPSATPEPATMLLMGAGLAGLGFVKRRRQA